MKCRNVLCELYDTKWKGNCGDSEEFINGCNLRKAFNRIDRRIKEYSQYLGTAKGFIGSAWEEEILKIKEAS